MPAHIVVAVLLILILDADDVLTLKTNVAALSHPAALVKCTIYMPAAVSYTHSTLPTKRKV